MPRTNGPVLPTTFNGTVAALQKDFVDRLQGVVTTVTSTEPNLAPLMGERLRSIEDSMVASIAGIRQQISGGMVQVVVAPSAVGVPPHIMDPASAAAAPSAAAAVAGPWKIWKHTDGGFKNVPPGFILPGRGNSVQQCFRLWMLGDPSTGIRPYRALSTKDFGTYEVAPTGRKLNRTAMTRRYCEWKKLFE